MRRKTLGYCIIINPGIQQFMDARYLGGRNKTRFQPADCQELLDSRRSEAAPCDKGLLELHGKDGAMEGVRADKGCPMEKPQPLQRACGHNAPIATFMSANHEDGQPQSLPYNAQYVLTKVHVLVREVIGGDIVDSFCPLSKKLVVVMKQRWVEDDFGAPSREVMDEFSAHFIAHRQEIETVQQGTSLREYFLGLLWFSETGAIAYPPAFRIVNEIEKIYPIKSMANIAIPHLITADNHSVEVG